MLKVTILDGYVDEPTCLGVPPYISPYPRYIAGAIWSFDKKTRITYLTIDQILKGKENLKKIDSQETQSVVLPADTEEADTSTYKFINKTRKLKQDSYYGNRGY